jgi:hypothetical protein
MTNSSLVPAGDEYSRKLLTSMTPRSQKAVDRSLDRVKSQAVVAAAEKAANVALAMMHEQGRGAIANVAMHEVAALSAFEEHLAKTVPAAAPRVAAIANAYTTGAVEAVMRW